MTQIFDLRSSVLNATNGGELNSTAIDYSSTLTAEQVNELFPLSEQASKFMEALTKEISPVSADALKQCFRGHPFDLQDLIVERLTVFLRDGVLYTSSLIHIDLLMQLMLSVLHKEVYDGTHKF